MFVADLHNDLVQRMMIGEDVTQLTPHGHTDIPRLKESSIDLEVLSQNVVAKINKKTNKKNNFIWSSLKKDFKSPWRVFK